MSTLILRRQPDIAIDWGKTRINQLDGPKDGLWTARCQQFSRMFDDVAAWASAAIIAWETIPENMKYVGGLPHFAPRASKLYFAIGKHGHVMPAVGVDNRLNALSNDYMRPGRIDITPRDIPRWGAEYLGWSYWTPFGSMRPSVRWDGTVPDIDNIRRAMETGRANTAAYRLACRLDDFGFYKLTPQPNGVQGYPKKAVAMFQKAIGGTGTGRYGEKTHNALFGQTYGGMR